jgi:alpha-galactosidase
MIHLKRCFLFIVYGFLPLQLAQANGLPQAVSKGDVSAVKQLLADGADVNGANAAGWTALHYAAIRDKAEVAKVLLDQGARVDAVTTQGKSALFFCSERKRHAFAALLLDHGANLSLQDERGWAPLHFAAVKGDIPMMELFLSKGANINQPSNGGGTPLHEAVVSQSEEVVTFLLDNGAQIDDLTKDGTSSLAYAIDFKNEPVVALLKKHGAKVARPMKVFLLVGQSNMEGKGKVEHLKILTAQDGYKHLVDAQGEWVVRDDVRIDFLGKKGGLTVGYASPEDRFGPELQFGHVVGDAFEEPVLLLKHAWGGKSLAVDFRPPSAGGEVGAYYTQVLDLTNAALNGAPGHQIAGLVWFQGWNDRVNQAHNDAYAENLAHFIRDIRKDLGIPNLPFVIGETGQGGPNETHPRALSLMKHQAAVAAMDEFKDNTRLVKTTPYCKGEPKYDGEYHFFGNAENFFNIGNDLGEAMLELLVK